MSDLNQNSGYGQAMTVGLRAAVAAIVPTFGRILAVFAPGDSTTYAFQNTTDILPVDNEGRVHFFTDLASAYAEAQSNNNDVIVLAGNGTHAVTTGLNITKNRVHFLGLDGGGRYLQQGARIALSGDVASAYVLKNTGVRNTFRNIKFIQGSTNAAALNVVQEGGEGTYYGNCSFVFGVVNNLDEVTAAEFLAGSDSATYEHCTFGADTLLTSAARAVFLIDQVNGFEFKSNQIHDCTFNISSSNSRAAFVRLAATGDILFSNLFNRCNFVASVDASGGAAIAEAAQTGTGTTKGCLQFSYPAAFNCTDFSTATSGRNANIQIVAPTVVAASSGVGVTPTA